MKNLLLQPVDSINRPDSTAGNELTLFLLFLAGLLGGLFFVIGLRQPQLQQFFSLNRATVAPGTGTGTHFFLFMQGFGIGLGLTLLPAFLHHILLRLIFRQHMTLVRLITELNPAYFYTELFLLGALLVLPGSVFSAVLMLVAGFGVSALAQYLVMRRLTSFDENRCFMLIAFVLLIQTSITALLFNLSLPLLNALLDHSVVF